MIAHALMPNVASLLENFWFLLCVCHRAHWTLPCTSFSQTDLGSGRSVSSHRIYRPLDLPHMHLRFVRHIDDPPGPPHTPRLVTRHIDVLHRSPLVPRDDHGRSQNDSQLCLRHNRCGFQFCLCPHPIFDLFVNHELAKVRSLASRGVALLCRP